MAECFNRAMLMTFDRYLKNRRYFETGFWILLFLVSFFSQIGVVWVEAQREELGVALWQIMTWEGSSNFMLLCLVPVVLLFDKYFPLGWKHPRRNIAAHILFTLVFSLIHVVAMVWIRKLVYVLVGERYDFGNAVVEFFYEYLKDFRSYGIILALIYLYRHIVFRMQGEASLLDKPDDGIANSDGGSERLLVKKLGREFLIRVNDIERIEAAGNYVNLHIGERIYPLRETMGNFEKRLNPDVFKRIHRSHIVNINWVREIRPLDTGDARVFLTSDVEVPMSRTYRTAFN